MNKALARTPQMRLVASLMVAAVVLGLMAALATGTARAKSPTFDEQGFILRGLAAWRGYRHFRVGHPLGLNALNASLLAADDTVTLPVSDPSWAETSFHRPAELFLWEIGNRVEHVIFLARLPTIWLAMLMASVVARWTSEATGSRAAGAVALLLIAMDPNILAHASLATTDLGLAAAAALAAFTLWRFFRQPGLLRAVVGGAAFGLLQNTKFTAGLFLPLFGLAAGLVLWARLRQAAPGGERRLWWRAAWLLVTAYPLAAFLTLWAAYGFDISRLPENLPTMSALAGRVLPLAHHLEQLLDLGGRLAQSTPAFLLGEYSDSGWWYYFPVAFLLKTPLPVLLLLLAAVVRAGQMAWRRRPMPDRATLSLTLVPALGYLLIALTSEINLGYRHLLPLLPLLAVFCAVSLGPELAGAVARRRLALVVAPVAWLAVITLGIYPHYLAFFNLLAGGPAHGWRHLVDSNLDWGQDLGGLKEWLDERQAGPVWLSYFGEARPEYYNIDYLGLPSFPPRLMDPAARPYYPPDPAPGLYAISATNLQGALFQDHDLFATFRQREPIARIGYSIFIYEVAARGRPVDLLLNGLQVDELPVELFAELKSNDVHLRWLDIYQAFLWPAEQSFWLASGDASGAFFATLALDRATVVAQSDALVLFRFESRPGDPWGQLGLPGLPADGPVLAQGDGRITFRGAALLDNGPTEAITLLSAWEQMAEPAPAKLFVHLLDEQGRLVSQWDGLGAAWQGWREGDILVQLHELPTDGMPTGEYTLAAGLYHPERLERWLGPAGDTISLGPVSVP
jgi:hypothetical protein